ncbi:MAG TPA: FeoA family protein [Hyphomicrobiales bacterium]|nr:FeoA family protein [Kaistiaceae bacterium]HQF31715.1 FeoA family protein [Hyphomicrobiales bacterium]
MFPLALAAEGEKVRIAALRAGKGLSRRLTDLGLPLGAEIRVMQRRPGGAMIVGRDALRVALGAGMAQKVMVALATTAPDAKAA